MSKEVEAVVEEPIVDEKELSTINSFLEHQKQALDSAGKALDSLIPNEVKEHGSKAVEEMIEGYRGLFNDVMNQLVDRVKSTQDDVNGLVDKLEGKEEKEAE